MQNIKLRLGWPLLEQLSKTGDPPLNLGLPELPVKARLWLPSHIGEDQYKPSKKSRDWSQIEVDSDPGGTAMPQVSPSLCES